MNTDNTSISGETIDYGPCALLDEYNPAQVFSSIDELGRYAYANQPRIALWNLTRLAECLLPLFSDEQDKAIEQAQFDPRRLPGKIHRGLPGRPAQEDRPVHARATATRRWCRTCSTPWRRTQPISPTPSAGLRMPRAIRPPTTDVRSQFTDPAAFDEWAARWRQRLGRRAAVGGRTARRDARGQPRLHPAQPPHRGGDPGRREQRRLRAVRGIADGAVEAVRRSAGSSRPMPIRRCRINACCRRSAGREDVRCMRRRSDARQFAVHQRDDVWNERSQSVRAQCRSASLTSHPPFARPAPRNHIT